MRRDRVSRGVDLLGSRMVYFYLDNESYLSAHDLFVALNAQI